jgi:hypothetical protein
MAVQPPSATWRFDRDRKLQSKEVQPPSATDSAVQPTAIKSSATQCNQLGCATNCNQKQCNHPVQPTQTATKSIATNLNCNQINCNQNFWRFDRHCIKLQPKLLVFRP